MNPIRLTDVAPLLARVIGCGSTDSRIADYVNEAQSRALDMGKWLGSVVRLKICSNSSCLTWPRQVATIEGYSLCAKPGIIRDHWYEFLPNGPGMRGECCGCPSTLIDRDPGPTFEDIWDAQSNLALQCDVAEAAGAVATIQGYDGNAQWIRTQVSGAYVDGLQLPLSTSLQVSPQIVTKITRVILPGNRNGMARLYQYSAGAIVKPLGFYEPDETVPWYRKSLVPGLARQQAGSVPAQNCGCDGSTGTSVSCCCQSITVIAKLRHIDVANPNDWLILQNKFALKKMVMGILKEERNLEAEAQAMFADARKMLDDQEASYQGDAVRTVLNVAESSVFGAGEGLNDIDYPVNVRGVL